jgi:hypothetical protein
MREALKHQAKLERDGSWAMTPPPHPLQSRPLQVALELHTDPSAPNCSTGHAAATQPRPCRFHVSHLPIAAQLPAHPNGSLPTSKLNP